MLNYPAQCRERDDLSGIELTFQVNYYLPQRTAGFHTMSHTKVAEEYGVQYQLGYIEREGENPRLSPPMSIGEIKDHRFAVNILDGGALIRTPDTVWQLLSQLSDFIGIKNRHYEL